MGFQLGTSLQQAAYTAWINSVTNNGTSYPKLNPNGSTAEVSAYNSFISGYNSFLTAFNALTNNPYHSVVLNLTPQAFIKLFNNIDTNCL